MTNATAETTAAVLGDYYRELIDQGLPEMAIHELIVIAARELVHEGLLVRAS